MPLSLEIRARVDDAGEAVELVAQVTGTRPEVLDQEDVFFEVHRGRLMLRRESSRAELIFYSKREEASPRLSAYFRRPLGDPDSLEADLTRTFGVRRRVRKRRWLFEFTGARISVDVVESVGAFLEIGIPARDTQAVPQVTAALNKLANALRIDDSKLVSKEYETLLGESVARA